MFLKRVSRKNKDGTEVSYLQIVRSSRKRGQAHPTTEVLLNLGREDELDREALRELASVLRAAIDEGPCSGTSVVDAARPIGVKLAVRTAFISLGLGDALRGLPGRASHDLDAVEGLLAAIATTLVHREVGPDPLDGSGVAAWRAAVPSPAASGLVHDVGTHSRILCREVHRGVVETCAAPVGPAFVHFHVLGPNVGAGVPSGRPAPLSRDRRLLAIAVSPDGRVLNVWPLPAGSELCKFATTMRQDLLAWGVDRMILVVHGRGLAVDLAELRSQGVEWVAGLPLHEAPASSREPGRGRFSLVRDGLAVRRAGRGGHGGPRLHVRDDHLGSYQVVERNRVVDALRAELGALAPNQACDACNRIGGDATSYVGCAFLGRPGVDEEAVRVAALLDGRVQVDVHSNHDDGVELVTGAWDTLAGARRFSASLDMGHDEPQAYDIVLAVLADAVGTWIAHHARLPLVEALRALASVFAVRVRTEAGVRERLTEPNPTQAALLARLGLARTWREEAP